MTETFRQLLFVKAYIVRDIGLYTLFYNSIASHEELKLRLSN